MSRNNLLVRIVAAAVGIVAIAIAAATVRSPIEPGGSGGVGTGDGGGSPPPVDEPIEGGGEVPALLEYLAYAIVVLFALAVAWYLIAHRRELVKMIAVYLAVGLVILALVAGFLFLGVADQLNVSQEPPQPQENESGGGAPGEGDGEAQPVSFGPLLGVLAVVTAIFVGALLLTGSAGGDDSARGTDGAAVAAEPDDVAAVGAAAGRAADRIEGADEVDNEVYRAWREMTGLLEVPRPETSTPGEFAAAAVDAGVEREHVDELTRLFEDVRYGHFETTAEMETRAVAVLRHIASEYATEHPDAEVAVDADDRRGGVEE